MAPEKEKRPSEAYTVREGGEAILVLITATSSEEALKIGRSVVEKRLAACANIVPQVRSLFSWEGKLSEENEVLLLVKSRRPLFGHLVQHVKGLHSYSVPEIIAVPILEGAETYLRWIDETTGG